MKLKEFIKKNREILLYLLFGFGTTVVSWASFALFVKLIDSSSATIENIFSWIFAVAFAFVTNKLFVFESKSWSVKLTIKELASFVTSRLLTGAIEIIGVPLLIKIGLDQSIFNTRGMLAKIIVSIIVVILNYILSKFIIFNSKEQDI